MPRLIIPNYTSQFRQAQSLLRKALRDGRMTQRERRQLLEVKWAEPIQALVLDTLQAKNVKQRYRSNFAGLVNPSGYQEWEIPYNNARTLQVDTLHQGLLGTCALLTASLNKVDYLLNPNQTVTFRFFDRQTRQADYVTVKDTRPVFGSSGFGGVLEKAYALWREKEGAVAPGKTAWQDVTDGNTLTEVIQDITGRKATLSYTPPSQEKLTEMVAQNKTVLFSNWQQSSQYIVGNHAYRVLGASSGQITVFNPWGYDGLMPSGNPNDGLICLSYGDLLKNLSSGFWAWET